MDFYQRRLFSAVCACQGKSTHGQPVDPDRIIVRARLRGHLDARKERFTELLNGSEIQESAGNYYDNFKSEVANHQGNSGAVYEHSLHDVSSVTYSLQKEIKGG